MTVDPKLLTGLGAALSIFLSGTGSAIASAHSGVYAIRSQDTQGLKGLVPIVISGVLSIYGIIVSIILSSKFQKELTEEDGYRNLSAGLSVGLACWASGWGMAKFINQCNEQGQEHRTTPTTTQMTEPLVGTARIAHFAVPPEPNTIFLMVLVFLEAIGLYGLIVALFLMG
uniref:V-type proton ATPase proteolipid subunit n=1 Tax=Attheya septentrionalis TaxID=420275 RepID=A0A7S2XWD3_9STRA|mmetsp:Transcript_7513/g.13541  ORF Transcript_7513/g.13541 Transcript_7513/m.13541 type:complete len:171 (+) Transcript_7513:254-766(+)